MKRFSAMLIAALLLMTALFGCKGKGPDETPAESETESATESAPAENETLTAEDFSYLLTDGGYIEGVKALDYVTLPDWSTIEFSRSETDAPEATIDEQIQAFADRYAVAVADRAVEKGDLVNMDYSGKLDGVAFEGGTATNQKLHAGSANFVDNFLTKIIGHMPGETFDIEITFPDPYQNNTDLSGKLTIFTVTIHEILEAPKLTEEWIAEHKQDVLDYFKMESVSSVDDIRKTIGDIYRSQNLASLIRKRFAEMEYTEMPDAVYDYMYKATDNSVYLTYGAHLSVVAAYLGYDDATLKELIMQDAVTELFYQAVAEDQKLTATDEDIRKMVGDNYDSVLEYYGKGYLARYVITDKAKKYLEEHVTIKD